MYSSVCTSLIPRAAATIGFIFSIIIIIIGVPGNFLTILSLLKSTSLLKNSTTYFIINLAFADLIFSVFNLPLTSIRYYTCSWPFGSFLCNLYPFFFYGNFAVSLTTITFITFNRLIFMIYHDIYSSLFNRFNVIIMIAFCWLFSFGLLCLPLFHLWGQFGLHEDTFSCTIIHRNNSSPKKFLFILAFFLPCCSIIISYSIIWFKVIFNRYINRKITSKRESRLTKLILIIFFTFILCLAPLMLANVFLPQERYPFLHVIASILSWFNCCVNPILYFALDPRYRKAFLQLFGTYSIKMMSTIQRKDTLSTISRMT